MSKQDESVQFATVQVERSYDMRAAAILHFNTARKDGKDLDDALDAAWRAMLSKSASPEQNDYDALRVENERLQGLLPEAPPRPPDGSDLPRYGLRWNGPAQPLSVPMDDGYWTPWHLADAIVAGLRQPVAGEREAFEAAYSGEYGTPLSVLRLLREGDAYIEEPQHDRLNSSWWMWKQARAALSAPAAGQQPTAYVIKGCGTVTLQYKERPSWADGDPTLTVTPLYEGAGQDVSALVEALESVVAYDEFAENDDTALMVRYADMIEKARAALAARKAGEVKP